MQVPEGMNAELIDGDLYTSPRPAGTHGLASSVLTMDIGSAYHLGRGGPGGWWILHEPEIHFVLNVQVLVPDIAGWRRERMPEIPDDHRFVVSPDWVCEVLSPSTRRIDLAKKRPIYARHGVGHLWFVDPDAQTVEVMRLNDEKQYQLVNTFSGDDTMRAEPFEELEIDLAQIWAPSPPPP